MSGQLPVFFRRRDIGIILLMLSVCCIAMYLLQRSKGVETAEISVNGELVASYVLADTPDGTFTLPEASGMVFSIEDGAISVAETNCPDKRCMHAGAIRKPRETIICMPHRLVITISAAEASDAPDVVIG